jgi:hypothetical protein
MAFVECARHGCFDGSLLPLAVPLDEALGEAKHLPGYFEKERLALR